MAQTINIGTEINLEDLVQSRLLIQANSGGGKSVTARVIMEEVFGKVPFITFDRDGEYYTLKEAFPDVIVIGGSFPDLALSLKSATLLPKEIIGNRLSVVIDLSDLKSGEKQTYVRDFLAALMDLPQSHWTPYLVFIEEAHFFCGEQDKNPAGPTVRELMAGGRKKGYCGVLITQRISKLHKDAAAECNNKFVGRTNLDIDMDRAARELGFNDKEKRLALRNLKPGHFFAYGTSIEPHHVHAVKIKLPKTKQPKAGMVTEIKPGKPTDKVLSALQKLNELPKEAAKEKVTVEQLERTVAMLRTELAKKPQTANMEELKSVQERLYAANRMLEDKDSIIRHYQEQTEAILKVLGQPLPQVSTPFGVQSTAASTPSEVRPAKSHTALPLNQSFTDHNQKFADKVYSKAAAPSNGDGSLGKCPLAIFIFLASFPERSWSKAQVGIATGYSPSSGGFNNALSELSSKGLITRDNGKLRLAPLSQIGDYLPKGFRPQKYSIETFKAKLGKCEREIYEALLEQPDRWFTKPDLAFYTPSKYSPTSGGFNNALSTLNTLELLERKSGEIRLNPELLEI